jgi:hypothetical protein
MLRFVQLKLHAALLELHPWRSRLRGNLLALSGGTRLCSRNRSSAEAIPIPAIMMDRRGAPIFQAYVTISIQLVGIRMWVYASKAETEWLVSMNDV